MRPVNLLPPEARATAKAEPAAADRPFGAYGVLAALALAIVAVALVVNANNGIKDRQAELTSVTAEAASAETAAAAMQRFGDFRELAANRVQTVSDLAEGRFDWHRSLVDLSRVLPTDAHLSKITASTTPTSAGGNPLRTGISAPAIELSGCTGRQDDIPELLTRLRNVRGVTRVALSSSGASDTGATAPTPAEGLTSSQLCRGTRAPTFEIAVFFEHSKVPQATTATAATPTPVATASPSPTPTATP